MEKEDLGREIRKRAAGFLGEIEASKNIINSTSEGELVIPVIKDFIDQIFELKKKDQSIKVTSD